MKQPKKLTRANKEILASHNHNPNDWMLHKETEFYLYLVHKTDGRRLTVDRFKRR